MRSRRGRHPLPSTPLWIPAGTAESGWTAHQGGLAAPGTRNSQCRDPASPQRGPCGSLASLGPWLPRSRADSSEPSAPFLTGCRAHGRAGALPAWDLYRPLGPSHPGTLSAASWREFLLRIRVPPGPAGSTGLTGSVAAMQQPPQTGVLSVGPHMGPSHPRRALVPSLQQLLLHPQPGSGGWWVWALSTSCACKAPFSSLPPAASSWPPTPAPEAPLQVFHATAPSVTTGSSPTWAPADQGSVPGYRDYSKTWLRICRAGGQVLALGLPSPPPLAHPLSPSCQGPGRLTLWDLHGVLTGLREVDDKG